MHSSAAMALAITATLLVYCCNMRSSWLPMLTVLPTFFFGATVHSLKSLLPRNSGRAVRWLPDLFALLVVIAPFAPQVWGYPLLIVAMCGLLSSLVYAEHDIHSWWKTRPLLLLGEVSYSLYMTHTLAQKVLYRLLPSGAFDRFEYGNSADGARRICLLNLALVPIDLRARRTSVPTMGTKSCSDTLSSSHK